ncbi:Do family serine endopeptidase [Halothiobacillus sp. DCM-1]|uniref:Do family serine endopeptidase n=1 Tax=Halothiobacillus sp. DCM-1 TaxID=3112558 RepID=UPI0032541F97
MNDLANFWSARRLRRSLAFGSMALWLLGATGCGDHQTGAVTGLPDFSALVKANNASVVNITAVLPLGALPDDEAAPATPPAETPGGQNPLEQFFQQFFGFNGSGGQPQTPAKPAPIEPENNSGSGFIIDASGDILTNAHVIDGAKQVFVRLADGREFKAQVLGRDEAGDIALLKIDANNLKPVRLGNSDQVLPGQWAVAIGSPFGFDHSVTAGVISAVGRALPDEPDQRYVPFLQTDVAINPGSSGGPLFNVQGEVIGINAQIFTESGGYDGLSFAIPINYAMGVVKQLKAHGSVARGFLGVQVQSLTREMAEALGVDRVQGALVTGFVAGSPAEKSSLQPGDIITAVDGSPIHESADLSQRVGLLPPGSVVKLTVFNEGKTQTVRVTLAPLPKADSQHIQSMKSDDLIVDNYGLLLTQSDHEVRVKAVDPQGPAARAGLMPQDVLLSLNQHEMNSLDAAQTAFISARTDTPNAVLIRRGSEQHFIALSLTAD